MGNPPPGQGADPFAGKGRVLAVVALGVFMATLDSSIVNLALPSMAGAFRVDAEAVSPVVSAYLIAIAASLLLFGAVGDRIGRRRLYLAGLALFTLGSGLCATAWSLEALVAFRALQGIGGAMMFSLGPAILTSSFPPQERGRALGWIGSAVAGGQTAGPVLGGLLLNFFGWPSIFVINLPVGVAAYVAAGRVLSREDGGSRFHRADGSLAGFDLEGAVLLPAGLLFLMALFDLGPVLGPASPPVVVLACATLAAFALLRRVEGGAEAPLVELTVLGNRQFVASNLAAGVSFIAIGSVLFILPFYLRGVLGFEAYQMGLALLPIPLAIAVVGPLSGRLSDRVGPRAPCAAGLTLAALAVVSLAALGTHAGSGDLVWRLAAFGGGMALFQSPNNSAAMGALDRRLLGLASGMIATMRSLGLALGVSLGALLLSGFYAAQTGGVPLPTGDLAPDPAAFVEAQRATLLIIAAVLAVGVATSLVRPSERPALPTGPSKTAPKAGAR